MGKRLISCDFINASSFKVKLSNKAKLMYLFLITNADDKGFVANALETAKVLEEIDNTKENNVLVPFTYEDALQELIQSGHIYQFTDNHGNNTFLIRHWFCHNKLIKGLESNYQSLLKQVELIDNEWCMKKKPLKENKESKENNTNNENNEKTFLEELEEDEQEYTDNSMDL